MTFVLLVLCFGALLLMSPAPRLSPDGQYYLLRPNVMPYVLRGTQFRLWRFANPVQGWSYVNGAATLLTAVVLEWAQFGAGFLFLGLACTRTNVVFPVLTDQLGLLCLTLGVVVHPGFFIVGGLFNEKAPLLGGLIHPMGFVGLIGPLARWWWCREPLNEKDPEWLHKPLQTGLAKLRQTPPQDLILPWGVAAIGLVVVPWYLVLAAYLPLLGAQDRARVYQWISPIVCLAAATQLPTELVTTAMLVHFLNPWRQTI